MICQWVGTAVNSLFVPEAPKFSYEKVMVGVRGRVRAEILTLVRVRVKVKGRIKVG